MIGSVPPQPAPFQTGNVSQYMTDVSNAAFEELGRRQQYISAASTHTYPNMDGLDTNNLGGNIHPSAIYSSFSFDNTGLPPYPQLQHQNGNAFHQQHHDHGFADLSQAIPEQQDMYYPQPNGFPDYPPQHAPHQPEPPFPSGLNAQQPYASISPSPWNDEYMSGDNQYAPPPAPARPSAVQLAPQQSTPSSSLSLTGNGASPESSCRLQNPYTARASVATAPSSSPASNPASKKRKIVLKQEGDADDDDEDSDAAGPVNGAQQKEKEQKKTPQACSHCKRLKMKCVREEGQAKCERCLHRNQECEFLGRKPRVKSNWRDVLNKKLQEKDKTIQYLLKQLNNPWTTVPFHATSNIALQGASVTGAYNASKLPPTQRSPSDIQAWVADATAATSANGSGGADHLSPASAKSQPQSIRAQLLSEGEADSDGEADESGELDGAGIKRGRSPAELIPMPDTPFGLLADSSMRVNKDRDGKGKGAESSASDGGGDAPDEEEAVGFANQKFFAPGPTVNAGLRRRIIEWQTPPEITERGIVSPDEVRKLFSIFYDRLNPVLAIFDPAIHTPAHVYGRCPFLFTVVCAIASRYYRDRPELYQIAMHLARTSAATSLINRWKSLEICQAYILMSVYSLPAKRWEEDRSWLYLGLAIRMATDLNLHVPVTTKAPDEVTEREILNRYRTWQICFNLDRSAATQLGRPTAIREDYIIRHSANFYKRSKYNHPYDIHLCAYTSLLRIMARFLEAVYSDPNAPTGLNKNIDWLGVTTKFEEELQKYKKDTEARFAVESNKRDPACRYRVELLPFLFQYSRLVLWSFGFQQAFEKKLDPKALSNFFKNAYGAATEVVRIVVTRLSKTEYFSFAPDGHFLFVAFASAFLLKLLRPEFLPLLADTQQAHIVSMITSVVEVFNSVAIDNMHTPRLYARFLQTLLEKRHTLEEPAPTQVPPEPENVSKEPMPRINGSAPQNSGIPAPVLAPAVAVTTEVQMPAPIPQQLPAQAALPTPPTLYVEGSVSGAVSTVGDETEVPPSTYGGSLFNLDDMENDDDYLASMRALNNANWASNMLLPGWTWPADEPMDGWFAHGPEEQLPVPDAASYIDQLSTFNLNTM
ncbi:hypothetical protein DACRYDRAFT_71277 [Dacryopinax primogenitus]|uniref:Zn(2)-C6 fungal-type domain-containing protein n=1 Tax=Dacryopinax primogenitus (strain DJM 731) TaxID=1858805 RepID=M5FXJ6_DACPD|nr:uncharacterized protein DACRYDRAFT_71277 [Dacryopinax primogenitus]EJT98211.1 hypothetical protein DACRYDRAFT_71277 [Dacryopinax primogenitus]